jgi:hypothetical protein
MNLVTETEQDVNVIHFSCTAIKMTKAGIYKELISQIMIHLTNEHYKKKEQLYTVPSYRAITFDQLWIKIAPGCRMITCGMMMMMIIIIIMSMG